MQVKTTMRYYLTPVRMAIISKSTNNTYQRGCREMRTHLLLTRVCIGVDTWETNLSLSNQADDTHTLS